MQFWSCVIGHLNCHIALWSLNIKIFTNIPWRNSQTGRYYPTILLTHWGRVMHICVSKLTIIGSDNGLSPNQRQVIIWTNAGILLIGPLGTNFSEIFNWNSCIFIQENAFEDVVWKMAAILSRPQCVNPLRPGIVYVKWVLTDSGNELLPT